MRNPAYMALYLGLKKIYFSTGLIIQHIILAPELPLGSPLEPKSSSFSWITIDLPKTENSGSPDNFTWLK